MPEIVFIAANHMEAEMIRNLLRGSGVAAFLLDANISRVDPFYANAVGGVKVIVRRPDAARAKEVLEAYFPKRSARPAGTFSPEISRALLIMTGAGLLMAASLWLRELFSRFR